MPSATLYSSTSLFEKVIHKIETPLVWLFSKANDWLPETTKINTNKHNCHLLIDLRDTLLARWFGNGKGDPRRQKAIRAMFDFIISKYDRDNVNGGYLDDFLYEWSKTDWVFRKQASRADLVKALDAKQFSKVMDLIE